MTLATRIAGIPCKVEVTHFLRVKPYRGSASYCDSPDDYYGYTEVEFSVLDSRGRPAPWLEKKMTEADRSRITGEIEEDKEKDDE